MGFALDPRKSARGLLSIASAVIILAVQGGQAHGAAGKAEPPPMPSPARVAAPEVGTTAANLQKVFSNEVNAKEYYVAAASQADREGYPYVAQLFRACARAEEAHADLHVLAIAWGGGEARAMLQRLSLGTTAENLRGAFALETHEATEAYPALLAKAREENKPAAVRSMTLALAAERQHARLMEKALETLDQRLPAATFHVCEQCGNTVEALDFKKCPHCFAGRKQFVAVR